MNNHQKKIRVRFFYVIAAFGGVALITYAIINFALDDYPIAVFELGLAGMVVVGAYLVAKTKYLTAGSVLGMIPLLAISLNNYIGGGFESTGLLWIYVFPAISLFVLGRAKGIIFNIALAVSILSHYLLYRLNYVGMQYTELEFLMFTITYASVFFLTLIYQIAWDRSEESLVEQYKLADEANQKLKLKANELIDTEKELKSTLNKLQESNEELTELNDLMVTRELKMAELKEQIGSSKHKPQ